MWMGQKICDYCIVGGVLCGQSVVFVVGYVVLCLQQIVQWCIGWVGIKGDVGFVCFGGCGGWIDLCDIVDVVKVQKCYWCVW